MSDESPEPTEGDGPLSDAADGLLSDLSGAEGMDAPEPDGETPAPATDGESPLGELVDRAMNTEPNVSLDDPSLDGGLWDPERGGSRRITRGLMKFGDFSGLPAIADILIGAVEMYVSHGQQPADPRMGPFDGQQQAQNGFDEIPDDWGEHAQGGPADDMGAS